MHTIPPALAALGQPTLDLDADAIALLTRQLPHVVAYRAFIESIDKLPKTAPDESPDDMSQADFEEIDFRGVTLGFMVGRGVPLEDAIRIDTYARYTYQYWC